MKKKKMKSDNKPNLLNQALKKEPPKPKPEIEKSDNKEVKADDIKLSACLILKNEGKTIYRCLNSLKNFVDEFIIGIDESTDDNTFKEIEKFLKANNFKNTMIYNDGRPDCVFDNKDVTKCMGEVYSFKWQNDFSKARNEGMDKATGDYILIMDGHEYFPMEWYNITEMKMIKVLEGMNRIKEILAKSTPDEVHLQLYQQPFTGGIPNNFFLQPRIYRNGGKWTFEISEKDGKKIKHLNKHTEDKEKMIRFTRAAHNTIENTDQDNVIHLPEIIIIHQGEEENRKDRKDQRLSMNPDKLLADIKKNSKDTRAMFYLGNTYLEAKKHKEAIKWFDKYLKFRKDDNSEKYQVLLHKALCYKALNMAVPMRDTLHQAVAIDPLRRDAHSLLGELYDVNNQFEKAIFEYTTCLNLKPTSSRMFQNGATLTWDPHQRLAFIYAKTGNIPKAIAHLQTAYGFFPNEKWAEQIAKWNDNRKNVLLIDRGGSFTKDLENHLKQKYNMVISKRYDTRLAIWSDYIWCEWGNDDAYMASKTFPQKTVIRVHGWEAYGNLQTCKQILFNDCRKVVFVAEHIRERLIKECGINKDKTEIIHNAVDTDKFFIKEEKRDPKNVGYAGYMNCKKNPFLLLQIIKNNPDKIFHLRIDHQDPFWEATFKYELKDCKNMVYHARYDNLNDFWNQMTYVISTSIIESFSYNIAEAMACGCQPVIYAWNGVDEFWRKEDIFVDKPRFKDVTPDMMKANRKYIVEKYPMKDTLEKMEKVLIPEVA